MQWFVSISSHNNKINTSAAGKPHQYYEAAVYASPPLFNTVASPHGACEPLRCGCSDLRRAVSVKYTQAFEDSGQKKGKISP